MNNFIKLDYQLIQDPKLTLEEKVLLSYLKGFQDENKYCFQSQTEIALFFNIPLIKLKRSIKNLKEKNIIFTSNDPKYFKNKKVFNNKKAIILVDSNNPLPNTPILENVSDVFPIKQEYPELIANTEAEAINSTNITPTTTEGGIDCHIQNWQEITIEDILLDNPQQEEDSVLKQEDAALRNKNITKNYLIKYNNKYPDRFIFKEDQFKRYINSLDEDLWYDVIIPTLVSNKLELIDLYNEI